MGAGTLTIYSASAGSGKTFKLAGSYLARLFRSKSQYRRILAVTFTNKATAEMKGRILDQLYRLASGSKSDYLQDLIASTGKTEDNLRIEAKDILFSILHDFSRFSVCTIDSFFQKIIRAFARESGLNSGFNMELDHSLILSSAVDEMIISSASDPRLSNWLVSYILSNLDEERNWNIKDGIIKLSEELFREKFKILSADEISNIENKEFLFEYIKKLKSTKSIFEKKMIELGREGLKYFSDYGLTDEMFFNRSRGVPGYIKSLVNGKINAPNDKVRAISKDPPRWAVGEPSPQLKKAIAGGFDNLVKEAIDLYDENILNYNTINAILSNIYALGILSDVLRKVREVAYNNNIFLISDAGELLNLIINGDQTPYIYEKIGNRYENFMIDEFQDTSILQWNNFDPLMQNSMAGGYDNLVVGDVKQSIYRFRNSDWKILGHLLENEAGNKRIFSVPLKTNYRSRSNIITFNNSLFSIIPELIDRYFIGEPGCLQFKKLYAEAVQDDPGNAGGGYVRLNFVEDNSENEEVKESKISEHVSSTSRTGARWQDSVLKRLPSVIEAFQDKGFKASEIGILVRDRKEGADVLNTIIEYSINCPVEKRSAYNYNIVSNDSLTLSNSDAITFIISVLKVIIEPEDNISRALMERSYLLASGSGNSETVSRFRGNNIMGSPGFFPDDYEKFIAKAGNMTLFEATENIIGFFGLGSYPSNVPYLTTFQDLILEYSKSKNTDFHSFIEWWETSGELKSVVLPSGQDAIKVFTIHKSKGLEFPVVILPFLAWNLDHKPSRQPILWAKPPYPFNDLGIVPLRYGSGLSDTLFADRYNEERYSSYLDNVNLLYVAMTRAIDAMYGFIPDKPGTNNGIAKIIKESLLYEINPAGNSGIVMNRYYDKEKKMFEFGEIPVNYHKSEAREEITLNCYSVEERPRSLRLKLHSENYFLPGRDSARKKISYGQIMHEVFEGINSMEDIEVAVRQLVLEGKISEAESLSLILRLKNQVLEPPVSDWFKPGNRLMKEAGILLPSGSLKRPDRIIFQDDRTVIIDFKFGEENPLYINQIRQYQNILIEMGYKNTEAFLWYVDNNKIVIV